MPNDSSGVKRPLAALTACGWATSELDTRPAKPMPTTRGRRRPAAVGRAAADRPSAAL